MLFRSAVAGDVVKVSYLDRAGDDAYAVQDWSGNDAVSASSVEAQNQSPALSDRGPDLVQAVYSEPTTGNSTVYLIFTESVAASTMTLSDWQSKVSVFKNGDVGQLLSITGVSLKNYTYDAANGSAISGGYVFANGTSSGQQVDRKSTRLNSSH